MYILEDSRVPRKEGAEVPKVRKEWWELSEGLRDKIIRGLFEEGHNHTALHLQVEDLQLMIDKGVTLLPSYFMLEKVWKNLKGARLESPTRYEPGLVNNCPKLILEFEINSGKVEQVPFQRGGGIELENLHHFLTSKPTRRSVKMEG